jgi:ubiquinone/menaquinone biosynthesis C-methylase UbiE
MSVNDLIQINKMLKRKLYYAFPPSWRLWLRKMYYSPSDFYDLLSGKRGILTPPRGLIFVGAGEFRKTGEDLMNQVIKTCNLRPDARILDVGCGIGRLAVPLTGYLDPVGSYEGFDVVKQGIRWCNKKIHSRFPNFRFLHVDLKNDLYNLDTKNEARYFRFPYKDHEFDQVILTSVFTHMLPEDLDNYLEQIRRVMKPGGKCFVTFFLLNEEIRQSLEKPSQIRFPHSFGNYSLMDMKVKEANVAYDEEWLIKEVFPSKNLFPEAIHYGWWSGRKKDVSIGFQDVMILS